MDDGGFSCSHPYKYLLIRDKLDEMETMLDIGLSIKPWCVGGAPRFSCIAKQLLRAGQFHGEPFKAVRGSCLFKSASFLKPGHAQVFCAEHGPHSVWDFNNQMHVAAGRDVFTLNSRA